VLAFSFGLHFATCHAQLTQLAGKRVAVYISKKRLSFTPEFNQLFASYVNNDDSLGLSEEDIKLAFTIRLGTFLTDAFNRELGTDSSYFLNATPGIGQRFVKSYGANPEAIWSQADEFKRLKTDYIFLVDEMQCYTELRKSLLAYSNQLVTEHRRARMVQLKAQIYDVNTHERAAEIDLLFDQEKSRPKAQFLAPEGAAKSANTLLSGVFNLALERLFARL
jgi:hypothetical protein